MKKHLLSALLTLSLLMMFCAGAFAADIDNKALAPDSGSLTIHKYELRDMSKAGEPGDGNPAANIDDSAVELPGAAFDVYKIGGALDDVNAPSVPPAKAEFLVIDNYGPGGDQTALRVNVLNAAGDAVEETYYYEAAFVKQLITDNNGEAFFENLDRGYYYAEENYADSIEAVRNRIAYGAAPFVVAVPMTTADEKDWIENVHVYPKNQLLDIKKSVSENTAYIGERVQFTLSLPVIPRNVAKAAEFSVTDVLALSLTYVIDSLKITYGAAGEFIRVTDYILDFDPGANTLKVKFTDNGFEKLADLISAKPGISSFDITYEAIVNNIIIDEALTPVYHTLSNNASVIYKTANENASATSNSVYVDTGEVKIVKTDRRGNPLEGAVFVIGYYNSKGVFRYVTKVDGIPYTEYNLTGTAKNVNNANIWKETSALDTDGNASVTFAGLKRYNMVKDTDNPGQYKREYIQYYVIEIQAPDSYNLYGDEIPVAFVADKNTSSLPVLLSNDLDENDGIDNYLTASFTLVNSKGFTLPVTGGSGIIFFTAAGIVLVGIAFVLIICSRKKTTKSAE